LLYDTSDSVGSYINIAVSSVKLNNSILIFYIQNKSFIKKINNRRPETAPYETPQFMPLALL